MYRTEKTRELVLKGIPESMRGELWLLLSGRAWTGDACVCRSQGLPAAPCRSLWVFFFQYADFQDGIINLFTFPFLKTLFTVKQSKC